MPVLDIHTRNVFPSVSHGWSLNNILTLRCANEIVHQISDCRHVRWP